MVITLVTNQLNDWWDDPPLMLEGWGEIVGP